MSDSATPHVKRSHSIAVVIPARNEEDTIAPIVNTIRKRLLEPGIIDELIVIDSDSTDRTAAIASAAGATTIASREIKPELGSTPGKGEALWKSQFVSQSDIVVFVDADVTTFTAEYVTKLIEPLLADEHIMLSKAYYDRDLVSSQIEQRVAQGGRVTELMARPILTLWWPELASIVQPLAGEWAIRRDVLEQLSIPCGYGVEIAVLIDVYERFGIDAIAQVDLGARRHHHQDLTALSAMAAEVLAAADRRRSGHIQEPGLEIAHTARIGGVLEQNTRPLNVTERPPVREYLDAQSEGSAPHTPR